MYFLKDLVLAYKIDSSSIQYLEEFLDEQPQDNLNEECERPLKHLKELVASLGTLPERSVLHKMYTYFFPQRSLIDLLQKSSKEQIARHLSLALVYLCHELRQSTEEPSEVAQQVCEFLFGSYLVLRDQPQTVELFFSDLAKKLQDKRLPFKMKETMGTIQQRFKRAVLFRKHERFNEMLQEQLDLIEQTPLEELMPPVANNNNQPTNPHTLSPVKSKHNFTHKMIAYFIVMCGLLGINQYTYGELTYDEPMGAITCTMAAICALKPCLLALDKSNMF